ncbi:MAG: hypothetical protein ACPGDB_01685, partial [Fusobacterium sp.]
MKNSNEIPDFIKGYGKVKLYTENKVNEKSQDKVLKNIKVEPTKKPKEQFDDEAQKEFLKGARIAYETIITDF